METSVNDEDGDGCDINDEDLIENAKIKAREFQNELRKQSKDFEFDISDELAELYENASFKAGIQQEEILRDCMAKWLHAKGVIPEQLSLKGYDKCAHIRMVLNLLCFDFTQKTV